MSSSKLSSSRALRALRALARPRALDRSARKPFSSSARERRDYGSNGPVENPQLRFESNPWPRLDRGQSHFPVVASRRGPTRATSWRSSRHRFLTGCDVTTTRTVGTSPRAPISRPTTAASPAPSCLASQYSKPQRAAPLSSTSLDLDSLEALWLDCPTNQSVSWTRCPSGGRGLPGKLRAT
jgi:hypothetical protein